MIYIGLGPLIEDWGGGGVVTLPSDECGRIKYNQIKLAHRTGNGKQLLTWSTPAPASNAATGTPGQIAFDVSGNFYFCYDTNAWAQLGPGGYSIAF